MRNIQFSPDALDHLKRFKSGNQKLAFKVFDLITDIGSNPFEGAGKTQNLLKEISVDSGREELMMNIV